MKISNFILATLVAASLSGIAQDEKPIGCGKKPQKENLKKPGKDLTLKNDSIHKAQVKANENKCGKCGRG